MSEFQFLMTLFRKTAGWRLMQRFMLGTVSGVLACGLNINLSLLIFSVVTTGKVLNMAELSEVHGRAWEDVDVSWTSDRFYLMSNEYFGLALRLKLNRASKKPTRLPDFTKSSVVTKCFYTRPGMILLRI